MHHLDIEFIGSDELFTCPRARSYEGKRKEKNLAFKKEEVVQQVVSYDQFAPPVRQMKIDRFSAKMVHSSSATRYSWTIEELRPCLDEWSHKFRPGKTGRT